MDYCYLFFGKFRYFDCCTVWHIIGILDYVRIMFHNVRPHSFCAIESQRNSCQSFALFDCVFGFGSRNLIRCRIQISRSWLLLHNFIFSFCGSARFFLFSNRLWSNNCFRYIRRYLFNCIFMFDCIRELRFRLYGLSCDRWHIKRIFIG